MIQTFPLKSGSTGGVLFVQLVLAIVTLLEDSMIIFSQIIEEMKTNDVNEVQVQQRVKVEPLPSVSPKQAKKRGSTSKNQKISP